jgi:undecaprenyl-diphosphatase
MVEEHRAGAGTVRQQVEDWDRRILSRVDAAPRWRATDLALQGFSTLARGPGWLAVGGWLGLRGRRRADRVVATLVAAYAGSVLIALMMKALIDRPRPDDRTERGSTPSGHSLGAAACAAGLAAWRPRMAPAAFSVAVSAAAARTYLRRHNPSDAVIGSVMGAALGLGCAGAVRWWRH